MRALHLDTRLLEFWVDRPAETGCYGAVLRVWKLHMSVTWPREEDQP